MSLCFLQQGALRFQKAGFALEILFYCTKIYKHYLNYATLHTAELKTRFFLKKLSTSHNTCSLLSLGLIRIAEIRQVSFLPILTFNKMKQWIGLRD